MNMSRKISAREIVTDIKQGLSDNELRQKYELSEPQLEKVIGRLIDAGHMTPDEFPSAKGAEVDADAQNESVASTSSSTPPGFRQTTAGEKTKRSFMQQAASASWVIPLITIAVMGSITAVFWSIPSAGAILGTASAVPLFGGLVLGIIGCFGVGRHGARTTLVPGLIGATLNATILLILVTTAASTFTTNRHNILQKAADEANTGLPKMITEELRCDKVTAVNTSQMEFHYTFVDKLKDEIDADDWVAQMKPQVLKTYNTGAGKAKLFRDNKISLRFTYRDKEGQLIATIVVPGEEAPDKGLKVTK
jgi:hypothetical protein